MPARWRLTRAAAALQCAGHDERTSGGGGAVRGEGDPHEVQHGEGAPSRARTAAGGVARRPRPGPGVQPGGGRGGTPGGPGGRCAGGPLSGSGAPLRDAGRAAGHGGRGPRRARITRRREVPVDPYRSNDAPLALVSTKVPDPAGYGRVLRVGERLTGIVEEKDCTADQRSIREINAGVYVIDAGFLRERLTALRPANAQGEYYLTDLVALAAQKGDVGSVSAEFED